MSIKRFLKSIVRIANNKHCKTINGIASHIQWQLRKVVRKYPYEQKISRSRIIASNANCGVSALINSQGIYDYNNMNLVKKILINGGTFLDVGANIGSYTLIASECTKANVIAFEAHPVTFKQLIQNINLNSRNNVIAINKAIGNITGKVNLSNTPGSSTTHIITSEIDRDVLNVNSIRLDDFCFEYNISPDYMKVDVEGFEYEVLLGLGDYIKSVKVIIIEINELTDQRNDILIKLLHYLNKHKFIGPLYYDADNDKFLAKSEYQLEDPVYLSEDYLSERCYI